MADTNTYNKYNQPKKVISQSKFDALDKTSIPIGSEYDIVGPILESDLDSNILTKLNNNAKINTQNTFTQQQNFNNGIVVTGNITLNGDIVKTTTEELFVKDAIIHTRSGATTGLADNEYTGIQATKYDGTNDGQLIFDKNGTARVGDIGDTQPLATRSESAELLNNHLLKWDSTNNKLIDSGKTIDDFQSKLVSGTNIKTINGNSILGSGDLTISGGSSVNVVQTTGDSTTDVMSQKAVTDNFLKAVYIPTSGGYKKVDDAVKFEGNVDANLITLSGQLVLTKSSAVLNWNEFTISTIVNKPSESGRMAVEPNSNPTETSLVTVSSTGTHAYKKVSELVDTKSAQNIGGAKTFTSKPLFNAGAAFDAGVIAYDDFEAQKGIYVGNARIVSTFYGDGFISKDWQADEIVSAKFNFPINNAGTYYFAITPNDAPTEPSVVVNATDRTPTWKPVSELGGNALKVTVW